MKSIKDLDTGHFARDFVAGGISAALSKTVVAPLDRIKLILQVQGGRAHPTHYKGAMDAFVKVYKEEGLISFWRGNLPNVMRYFPTQAMNFSFKDLYKQVFLYNVDKDRNPIRYAMGHIAAGGAAGGTAVLFVYPLDFVRTRLAVDMYQGKKERKYSGTIDCIKKTYKTDGIIGLYRGFIISFYGIVIYRAMYFGFYDLAKQYLPNSAMNTFFNRFCVAQAGSIVAGLIAYPFDTVRRRMMMQSGLTVEQRKYHNTWHCFYSMYVNEGGIGSFFKGSVSNIFRGVGSALVLVLYDELQKLITI